ncbi:GerMN domain-containing protein [Neobacillus niacini]|uniref:GerMN domain-containing protein n=1 Tax=Neobacillus niacini TaxID=86668 RepID=UPI001C8D0C3D|nr:GerMN domain-containing protein [Neobacillus niacini]MBY0145515.1 negative regulator of sigma-X activity [Neobacillus niacini]
MKKSEWSDKQLEELLREMPRIQDHRNPRDIYQNISLKKRKRPAWIIPGLAAAAALFLFFLLVPKLFDGTQYSLDSAKQEESSSEEKISISEDNSSDLRKQDDSEQNEIGISDAEPKMSMTPSNKTAVYEEDTAAGTVFTYWIPDSQIQILVPVSILVTPDNNKDWLTNFTESMELLNEEEWGLTDYYPINAKLELDNNTVIVDVPNDHKYGQGSASETMFIDSLKKNIAANSQVNKIVFTTNGQPGIELGNYGVIEEIEVNPEGKHAYFLYTPDGLDTAYLVPSTETYLDINAAFEAMKSDQQQGLAASLVPGFPLKEFTIEDNKLIITMDENTTMENNQAAVYSYEAILLTAKEFGIETITVLNAPINFLGPFDLTKEMKVPLAPNHRPIQ